MAEPFDGQGQGPDDEMREMLSDPILPELRHDHENPAAVVGVHAAFDQATFDEPVDPVRHGAARDKGLLQQRLGAQLVRRPCPAQR